MAGYESIFERAGLLISANVNAILNKALGANSVAVFDEYVNRMNGALHALVSAEGVERGRSKTLARQIANLEGECAKLDADVDRLVQRGSRPQAAARQAIFNSKSQLLEKMRADLTMSREEVTRLSDARAGLEMQIEVARAKRLELVALVQQERAARVRLAAQAGIHVLTPGRLRGDELLERARQRLEIAEGKNEAAAAALNAGLDDLLESDEIDAQLESREARLLGASGHKELAAVEDNA